MVSIYQVLSLYSFLPQLRRSVLLSADDATYIKLLVNLFAFLNAYNILEISEACCEMVTVVLIECFIPYVAINYYA